MAVMMTTRDNPYNPFEDFDGWYNWDMAHGYSTCCLLARLIPEPSDEMPDAYNDMIKEQHIDNYVKLFPLTYKKVVDNSVKPEDNYEQFEEEEEQE